MKKALRIISLFLSVLLLFSLNINAVFVNASSMTLSVQTPCGVTLSVGEHGKVIVDGTEYNENAKIAKDIGSVVTYEVSANFLYKIDKVMYNGSDITDELVDGEFTAPALSEGATFSATFKFIVGGGSSDSESESSHSHETEAAPETKPSVTPVTEVPGRVVPGTGSSLETSAKAAEVTAVEPSASEDSKTDKKEDTVVSDIKKDTDIKETEKTSEKDDVKPETLPSEGMTTITPTDVPKAEVGPGYMGIVITVALILLLGMVTFTYLKKKKAE